MPEDRSHLRKDNVPAFGKPCRKPRLDKIDLCAVICSLLCLIVAICVISPRLIISWKLRFVGQIVVIGLLLSIMNWCLQRVAPTFFMILEVRYGRSTLQNYDALLRNTLFSSHTDLIWRLTILVLLILPLGLSAAYKRFTGGQSSAVVVSKFPGHYGLTFPPLGTYNVMNNSIYLAIDANAPFLDASSSDSSPPTSADLPTAYGYNTLLLDGMSAALLDIPAPQYMQSIQQDFSGNDYWNITASVNATVARYNTSTNVLTKNDDFVNYTFGWSTSVGLRGLSAFELFNGYDLGLLPGIGISGEIYCVLGIYQGSTYWLDFFADATDDQSVAFLSSASVFNLQRELCTGTWQVNSTDIRLVSGSCNGTLTNQTFMAQESLAPFPLDALPVMVHSLPDYSVNRRDSAWRLPAFAVSVASAYWARAAVMLPVSSDVVNLDLEIYYLATDEHIFSTRTTLDPNWKLYLVLAIQPFLIVAIFLVTILFYSAPIGKGFSLVAIMSGVDKDSLDTLAGAAFSGELSNSVRLGISVVDDALSDEVGAMQDGRIEYTLGGQAHKVTLLEKGKRYM